MKIRVIRFGNKSFFPQWQNDYGDWLFYVMADNYVSFPSKEPAIKYARTNGRGDVVWEGDTK